VESLLSIAGPGLSLSSRGTSIPLKVSSIPSTAKYLCIGMKNISNNKQLVWLYTNVAFPAGGGSAEFAKGKLYSDYGAASAVKTDFQLANNL
jgi:hypothetical protein